MARTCINQKLKSQV